MKELVLNLMKRGAITCTGDATIREVAQIMVFNRIRYCVVLKENNEVEGIISSRSILKAFGRDLDKITAKDILLPYTITVQPYHPLKDAIEIMKKKRIEHLIVVSEKTGRNVVYGILSAADLVKKMAYK